MSARGWDTCAVYLLMMLCFFFFQEEDGIRDYKVTGVQTCARPISTNGPSGSLQDMPAGCSLGGEPTDRAMLVLCESGRIRSGGGLSRKLLKSRASQTGSNSLWRNRDGPALEGSCRRWATGVDTGR